MYKKSNYVDCAKFKTFSTIKQKKKNKKKKIKKKFLLENNEYLIFLLKISIGKCRKYPLILTAFMIFGIFGPIYLIVLTGKLDIPNLKFLLILYSVC